MSQKWSWWLWALLILCALWMIIHGVMNVAWGAAKTSRYYKVENTIVRILGVGLIATGLLLPLRLKPIYWIGVLLLVLGAIDSVAASPFEKYTRGETTATLALVFLLMVTPAAVLLFFALRSD